MNLSKRRNIYPNIFNGYLIVSIKNKKKRRERKNHSKNVSNYNDYQKIIKN